MSEKFSGKKSGKSKASAFARAAGKAEPSQPKGDEFDYGKWRVCLRGVSESENGSYCFTFVGSGKDAKIGERVQWFSTAGKAAHVSAPRIKRLVMILSGIDDKDEYEEFDPDLEFLSAILNGELETAAQFLADAGKYKSAKTALAALTSLEFVIRVTKGGERDDGGNFHNADFAAIGDDRDDAGDEGDAPESGEEPESEEAPKRGKGKRTEPEEDEDDAPESEVPESEEEPESEPAPKRSKKKARGR